MNKTEISKNNPEKELIQDKSISNNKTNQINKKSTAHNKKVASKNDKSNKSLDEIYKDIFSDLVSKKDFLVKEIEELETKKKCIRKRY